MHIHSIFDPNQKEFKNDTQREVWKLGVRVVPLEVSLADITEPETRAGCEQIYAYTMELLTDMYHHTEDYENDGVWQYLYHCLDWFRFGNPGGRSEDNGHCWVLSGEISEAARERELKRIQKLSKFGFCLSGGGKTEPTGGGKVMIAETDYYILTNQRYPLLLKYWCLLNQAAAKRKVNFSNYVFLCDFRILAKKYKRTVDDLLRPLPVSYRPYFSELHEYALAHGAKLESHIYYGRFRYTYKKLYVLVLENSPALVEVPYRLHNAIHIDDEFSRFLNETDCQPDRLELIDYIRANVCICNGCAAHKRGNQRCGRWIDIHGKRRFAAMCHTAVSKNHHGTRLRGYTDRDVMLLKRMMDMRFLQIDRYYEERDEKK